MEKKLATKKFAYAFLIGFMTFTHIVQGALYGQDSDIQEDLFDQPLTSDPAPPVNGDTAKQNAEVAKNKQVYLEILELLKTNQLEDAEKKISKLLAEKPNISEFYNLQGLLETLKKNNDKAFKSYNKSIEIDPQNLTALFSIAKIYLEQGKVADAKKLAEKILEINDKFIDAHLLMADIALKQNKEADIEPILLAAQKKAKGNLKNEISIAYALGKVYMKQNKPEKVLNLAEYLTNQYPEDNDALSFLAKSQIISNQKKSAVLSLEKLIAKDKADIRSRFLLIRLYEEQPEKQQDILKLLNDTASIAPQNQEVLFMVAGVLTKIKHDQRALELADKIDSLEPKQGLGEIIKGDVFLANSKIDEALTAYQKAYKLNPSEKVLNIIVDILILKGNHSDAIALLNEQLAKNNNDQFILFKLATTYDHQKNYPEAEKKYQALLALNPDNATVLNNLAWIYFQQDNPNALKLAEKAIKKSPKSAAFLDTYGSILVKEGKFKQGIENLKNATELAPNAYDTHYRLAKALSLNGDKKDAQVILNKILSAQQSFSEKEAAMALLKELDSE